MWRITYNIFTIILFPFFGIFALTQKKIRKTFVERLWTTIENINTPDIIWVHAASIGEAVIAENLIRSIKQYIPAQQFIITTNTYYARDVLRKKFYGNVPVYSLPFDLTWSIKHFINNSHFKALILIETEIWPNLIWHAKSKNIPIIIVNGRISDKTLKTYKKLSFFLKHVFSHIDLVLAQSDEHAARFISAGMNPGSVKSIGNLKYFREIEYKEPLFKGNNITFGSVREKEIDQLFLAIQNLKRTFTNLRFFIAPREFNLIDSVEKMFSVHFKTARYSMLKKHHDDTSEVVIVDTIGDLLDIYRNSKVAFVGGSLAPYGGQNILEPLFFCTPVIFGPYIENFKDIADSIIKNNAGIMVQNADELFRKLKLLLENDTLREQMGNQGLNIIKNQREIMKDTIENIMELLSPYSNLPPSIQATEKGI